MENKDIFRNNGENYIVLCTDDFLYTVFSRSELIELAQTDTISQSLFSFSKHWISRQLTYPHMACKKEQRQDSKDLDQLEGHFPKILDCHLPLIHWKKKKKLYLKCERAWATVVNIHSVAHLSQFCLNLLFMDLNKKVMLYKSYPGF